MPVVRLKGRLDVASVPAFRLEVRELMKGGATTLVLDLTELASIDSSGLGAVIGGLRLAREARGGPRLAVPHPPVRQGLKLTPPGRGPEALQSGGDTPARAPPPSVGPAPRLQGP